MSEKVGGIYLGAGTPASLTSTHQFPTDPRVRREWPPRRVRLPGIGGSNTKQDWGRWAGDCRLVLSSEGIWIPQAFKAYLDALLLLRRQEYGFRDENTGLSATVVIADFAPTPAYVLDESGRGQWWDYTLTLDVIEAGISLLDFSTYTGS